MDLHLAQNLEEGNLEHWAHLVAGGMVVVNGGWGCKRERREVVFGIFSSGGGAGW